MTREETRLLLIDLCARLPYYTMVLMGDGAIEPLVNVNVDTYICDGLKGLPKPYLRPMSSMTEEEKEDLKKNYHFYFDDCDDGITNGIYSSQFNRTIYEMIDECDISGIIDWLNAHYFDYRELILRGLALEAPADMYKNE